MKLELILQKSSKLRFSFFLDRSAATGLETLVCWIAVVEKASLQFNLKDPHPPCLFICAQNDYFDIVWADSREDNGPPCRERPGAGASPGNPPKPLHLGLHTFPVCNIAIKLVVDFSPSLHTDRLEGTSSVKLFLVFLPMHLHGHMEPPPEMFASVEQPSHSVEDQCHIVMCHQTSECLDCVQNGKYHWEGLASVEYLMFWWSDSLLAFSKPHNVPWLFFFSIMNLFFLVWICWPLSNDILHENSFFCFEEMHRLFSVGSYQDLFSWIALMS